MLFFDLSRIDCGMYWTERVGICRLASLNAIKVGFAVSTCPCNVDQSSTRLYRSINASSGSPRSSHLMPNLSTISDDRLFEPEHPLPSSSAVPVFLDAIFINAAFERVALGLHVIVPVGLELAFC